MKKIIALMVMAVTAIFVVTGMQADVSAQTPVYTPAIQASAISPAAWPVQPFRLKAESYIRNKLHRDPGAVYTYVEDGQFITFTYGSISVRIDRAANRILWGKITYTTPGTEPHSTVVTHVDTYDAAGSLKCEDKSWSIIIDEPGRSYVSATQQSTLHSSPELEIFTETINTREVRSANVYKGVISTRERRTLDPSTGRVLVAVNTTTNRTTRNGVVTNDYSVVSNTAYEYRADGTLLENNIACTVRRADGTYVAQLRTIIDFDATGLVMVHTTTSRTDSHYNAAGTLLSTDVERFEAFFTDAGALTGSWTYTVGRDASGAVLSRQGQVGLAGSGYTVMYDPGPAGEILWTHVYDSDNHEVASLSGAGFIHPKSILIRLVPSLADNYRPIAEAYIRAVLGREVSGEFSYELAGSAITVTYGDTNVTINLASNLVTRGVVTFITHVSDPYRPYDITNIHTYDGSGRLLKEEKSWRRSWGPEPPSWEESHETLVHVDPTLDLYTERFDYRYVDDMTGEVYSGSSVNRERRTLDAVTGKTLFTYQKIEYYNGEGALDCRSQSQFTYIYRDDRTLMARTESQVLRESNGDKISSTVETRKFSADGNTCVEKNTRATYYYYISGRVSSTTEAEMFYTYNAADGSDKTYWGLLTYKDAAGKMTYRNGTVSDFVNHTYYPINYDLDRNGKVTYTHTCDRYGNELPEYSGAGFIHPSVIYDRLMPGQVSEKIQEPKFQDPEVLDKMAVIDQVQKDSSDPLFTNEMKMGSNELAQTLAARE